MQENTQSQVKFVPAICPKCGGQLEVNPSEEAAVCQYCGAAFIVDKAVQNYTVQNAKIDHVENVNLDLKGSVDSILHFAREQMKESRAERKENAKLQAESDKEFLKNSWKYFAVLFAVVIILFIIVNLFGFFN